MLLKIVISSSDKMNIFTLLMATTFAHMGIAEVLFETKE